MGVQTTADQKIYEVKRDLHEAISNLGEIVVDECHGVDDWNDEYRAACTNAMQTLIALRGTL